MYNKYPYTDFHELNLDWFLEEFKKLKEDWETTSGQWDQMQLNFQTLEGTVRTFTTFVENYFENLDVQDEINNKLDALVADGTLSTLLAPLVDDKLPDVVDDKLGAVVTNQLPGVVTDQLPGVVEDQIGDAVAPEIPPVVTEWLEDNVNPVGSAVVVDSSLSVSGAAADAKMVGKIFDRVPVKFEDSIQHLGTIEADKYVDPDSGTISSGVTTYKIGILDVTNVNSIYLSYSQRTILNYESAAYFDASGTYISGEHTVLSSQSEQIEYDGHYGIYFTIPSGAAQMILNLANNRDQYRYTCINYTKAVVNMKDYIYSDPFKGKKIINFGDSIFGNFRDTNDGPDKSISKMIQDYTGATVYNAGFGGCRMATAYQYWDKFSMHSLADSIASGDWSPQEQALIDGSGDLPAYFSDTVDMLKAIDFSEIDYLTIGYGTNDYTGNVSLSSYGDALKYSLEKILTKYPGMRIVVISPCWRWWASGGNYSYSSDDDQSANAHGDKLPDYVQVCKDVCDEYHIAYVDTYTTLGFNQFTYTKYFNGTDGTHPNQYGRQLRADRIIGQMTALF